ncbi:hypothetical protein DFH07DRAFT_1067933 [Mycena maculata]|uniref:Uncharacterized protein n=1 Tax=Mycena maculata TaxID=230809 RepID=A0AAD7HES7_9AGAR|nr:hypothetical protein DFH07DRAFT_1067933 [Mycena maculata]
MQSSSHAQSPPSPVDDPNAHAEADADGDSGYVDNGNDSHGDFLPPGQRRRTAGGRNAAGGRNQCAPNAYSPSPSMSASGSHVRVSGSPMEDSQGTVAYSLVSDSEERWGLHILPSLRSVTHSQEEGWGLYPDDDDEDWLKIPDVASLARYADFKYRLWFTRYAIEQSSLVPPYRQKLWWLMMVEGTGAGGDLWLWDDGNSDEAYIKSLRPIFQTESVSRFSETDWVDACRALGGRKDRTQRSPPLAHLDPRTRIRVIAWLITAAATRKGDGLEILITKWAEITVLQLKPESAQKICLLCGVSHLLPMWMGTMLEVYSLDDLRSIPCRYHCKCLERQFDAHLDSVGRNSLALPFLYELVVSPWPLILWTYFGGKPPGISLSGIVTMLPISSDCWYPVARRLPQLDGRYTMLGIGTWSKLLLKTGP